MISANTSQQGRRRLALAMACGSILMAPPSLEAQLPASLPELQLPDPKIVEVYRGNWQNTLQPCRTIATTSGNPGAQDEPDRPWRVDVHGRYPGWYPGVDVKHLAAAYLACEKNLPLVLRAWDLTTTRYLMPDGAVRPMTMTDNPHNIVPETTVDGSVVFYPLRTTANIDLLLLGDLIYRFSEDKEWLGRNLPTLRKVAAFLEGWIDEEGLLHSDSYDLDQVYREIDGVAQASACFAFRRLAGLESVSGTSSGHRHAETVARRLASAAERHFWDPKLGYYVEHLAFNNVALTNRSGSIGAVSSALDAEHSAIRAIDGVVGQGIDAFKVGVGSAGRHEWAARNQTTGAWLQVSLNAPTLISRVILINRTDPNTQPGERFAAGYLEFSDGSPRVRVKFNGLKVSRALASFSPRGVRWVKFTGTRMQGTGGSNAGLAEFLVLPAEAPYRKITHGMTDSSLAMVAFDVASDARAAQVWRHLHENEPAFYAVGDLHAPTWISERAESYAPSELNRRAPYKDCVAMARTWRYDALLRRRMRDGEGLYRTITYANVLFDRPSGGGPGFFAERYGLGRFQPGDEAQATIPAYAEYPAVYNSTVVQQALLGLDVDLHGRILIDPCVPEAWYHDGFGQEGCGILKDHDIGIHYGPNQVDGWISGHARTRRVRLRLPPQLAAGSVTVESNGRKLRHAREGNLVEFTLRLSGKQREHFTVK